MRRRISWLVVATTSAVVVSFVVPLFLLVRTLAEDRAMAEADQEARTIALLVASLPTGQLAAIVEADPGSPATQVLTASDRLLGPGPAMAGDPDVARARSGEGLTVVDDDGGRVLLPVVTGDGTAVVRSAVSRAELHDGVTEAWLAIGGLGVALLLAALAAANGLGRRVSEPLLGVADTAHRLRAGDLAARAEVTGTGETRELAQALNALAERTTELLATERAAVGDLSHRLRTPVTALRLDAEGVEDPEQAERLLQHVVVLQRTIDAIVNDARRPVRTDLAATCDAADVVRRRLEFWTPLADDQQRDLAVTVAPGPAPVGLADDDLVDLVDVLVDNVFAHTPEGTAFGVALVVAGDEVVLRVDDAGPGYGAPRDPDRVGSTGLGLDLASRTARSAGGSLTVSEAAAGGASVVVRLPLRG
jgi:signal transduction histidine kinase